MKRRPKTLPEAAWNYRLRTYNGCEAKYVGIKQRIEEAFIAGARWRARRRLTETL